MTPQLDDYAAAHSDPEPEWLCKIRRDGYNHMVNGRMCSGHLQGRLLKMLAGMARPMRVLELGTFTGYSALCLAEGIAPDATVDTVEADDELEDIIRAALETSPFGHKVRLIIGDALETMASMQDGSYDMVFIDADKRQYADYYEEALRLLRPGGFIFADNTLWSGHVVDPSHARDRQTAAIKDFNDMVAADPRVEKVILPLRDGLTLMRKP